MLYTGYANVSVIKGGYPNEKIKEDCSTDPCSGVRRDCVRRAAFTDQSDIKVDSKVIDTLVEKNVIKGYEDGSFKPDKTVSRAEMAKLIFVLRTGSDDASYYAKEMTDTFSDVTGTWASGYIKYCQAYGIVSGKTADRFDPDAAVTTTEAAKMLLVNAGHDVIKDGLTGASWASNTMKLADADGLLASVATKPNDALPRQYAAQMIYNASANK